MAVYIYKFRVMFDEIDDFVRDIEIKCSDNFEKFHHALIQYIGLASGEMASFSICDSKWNKKNEITLMDFSEENETIEEPEYDEDDQYSTSSKLPKFTMSEAVLNKFIIDPRQYIMYEYDFLNPKVFYIELLKISEAQPNVIYPRCTLSTKEMPKNNQIESFSNHEENFASDYDDGYNEEDFEQDTFDDSECNNEDFLN